MKRKSPKLRAFAVNIRNGCASLCVGLRPHYKHEIAIAAIRAFAPGIGAEISESEICASLAQSPEFAMKGYPYPDSKLIAAMIHKLIAKGLILRIRPRTYLIVADGVQWCSLCGNQSGKTVDGVCVRCVEYMATKQEEAPAA